MALSLSWENGNTRRGAIDFLVGCSSSASDPQNGHRKDCAEASYVIDAPQPVQSNPCVTVCTSVMVSTSAFGDSAP
ncbi:MAG: hypothetical protein QGH33_04130, partial [Pirellulaceae bacterium]|nr:hypothetical protein [Pirellulaceae bacterium]